MGSAPVHRTDRANRPLFQVSCSVTWLVRWWFKPWAGANARENWPIRKTLDKLCKNLFPWLGGIPLHCQKYVSKHQNHYIVPPPENSWLQSMLIINASCHSHQRQLLSIFPSSSSGNLETKFSMGRIPCIAMNMAGQNQESNVFKCILRHFVYFQFVSFNCSTKPQ